MDIHTLEGIEDTQSNNKVPFDVNKLPIETQSLLAVCKRESMTEYPSPEKDNSKRHLDEYPSLQTDNTKPFSQIYKRRKQNLNSNHSNVNGDSVRTNQDPPCSSTVTTAATTLPMATATATATGAAPKKHFLSALVEFSLMESLGSKESSAVQPPEFDTAALEASVPPNCAKFIKHLQSEINKLTEERETMKFEMMSAQAMINMLQSRVDLLGKENEELKRMVNHP